MNLAELFHACNLAGIRLANVGGQLELRGLAIPCDVKAGAAEHKKTLLALLPPIPEPSPTLSSFVRSPLGDTDAEERLAIQAEGCGQLPADALPRAFVEWDKIIAEPAVGPFCRYASHRLGWRSIHNALICATCHPPAQPQSVREWIWEPNPDGIKALVQWAESPARENTTVDTTATTGV